MSARIPAGVERFDVVPLSGHEASTVGDAVIAAAGLLPPQIAPR